MSLFKIQNSHRNTVLVSHERAYKIIKYLLVASVAFLVMACGGSSSSSSPTTLTISGSVSGLSSLGLSLTLRSSSTNDETIALGSGATRFTFSQKPSYGSSYQVSIASQPTEQTCTFTDTSSGSISTNVNNLNLICVNTYSVSGSISGLSSSGLSLTLRSGSTSDETIDIVSGATSFTFTQKPSDGSSYQVIIASQPTEQTCTLTAPSSGSISTDINNLNLICVANTYSISGSVSGLSSTGLSLTLKSSSTNDETIALGSGATSFTFTQKPSDGSSYQVIIASQPTEQTCTLTAPSSGSISTDINNLNLICVANTYSISGSVSGLSSTGLSLTLKSSSTNDETIALGSGATSFTFTQKPSDGSSYQVIIANQPTEQTCTLTAPSSGSISTDINNLNLICVANTYSISGSVSGLSSTGLSLTLKSSSTNDETIALGSGATSFTFTQKPSDGSSYQVIIASQPTEQTCTLTAPSSGSISTDINNLNLTCVVNTYTISGTVSSLSSSGLSLRLRSSSTSDETIAIISGATSFTFTQKPSYGSSYQVSITSQPTGQTCTLSSGSGIVASDVLMSVSCQNDLMNSYTISGSVNNIVSTGLTLALYTYDTSLQQAINVDPSNANFTFNPIAAGYYYLDITSVPQGHSCYFYQSSQGTQGFVSLDFGLITSSQSVTVTCDRNVYQVEGLVSGLTSSGLVLNMSYKNDGDSFASNSQVSIPINSNAYNFSTVLERSDTYEVSITSQPSANDCTLINAVGVITSADISNVNVTCFGKNNTSSNYYVDRVEMAQTLSLQDASRYLRVTPQRDLMVRAFIRKTNAQAEQPIVKLQSYSATQKSWTDLATMVCPTLTDNAVPIPSYNLSASCYANINASTVRSGLILAIVASDAVYAFAPLMISPYKISIVVLPLLINGIAPRISANDLITVQNYIQRRMPFAEVTVTQRTSSYTPTGNPNLSRDSGWSSVLNDVDTLRLNETDGATFYYGFIDKETNRDAAGAGLAYLYGRAGIGLKGSTFVADGVNYDWLTLMHELGHNLSLEHTLCGAPDPDPNYPYLFGALSDTPLYLQNEQSLLNPTTLNYNSDIMGYCNGTWFSDYSYAKMQDFMLASTDNGATFGIASQVASAIHKASAEPSKVLISGTINNQGQVTFRPVQATTAKSLTLNSGSHLLKLFNSNNQALEWRFNPIEVADATELIKHFQVIVPNISDLVAIELWHDNQLLSTNGMSAYERVADAKAVKPDQVAALINPPLISTKESNGELHIQWNHAAWPYLQVIYDNGKGIKHVLTLQALGGEVHLPISGLTLGGTFELSFSNGLRVISQTIAH